NTWLDATHDGYLAPFGLIHRRRLYLAGSGLDLRGEDSLIHRAGAKKAARRFVLRFHLHPGVQASLASDGSVVWLKVANGPGWQMRAQGGTLALAESVYLGQPGQRRRTEQIIVAGEIGASDPVVKWAFRRVEPA
ncbi:MAG TPA: heparinase II/III family protein, partial [Alphaproteobacteria bacterium]|nr:heparinase II/III family protein [Alphaproteobacteria bacterium]